jgi:hypothetical protein
MSESRIAGKAEVSEFKAETYGFWSAVLATILLIFSGVTASTALKIPSLISGILLVPAFVLLMASIHEYAPAGKKAFSRLGLLFSLGYAVLIGFNYYMQLTLVPKGLYSVPFAMDDPQSIMWVIEVLGYGFMGFSTLFASRSFGKGKPEQAVRWLFIVNGVLGIGGMIGYAIGLSMSVLFVGLLVWDVIMPASTILLALVFRSARRKMVRATPRVSV